MISSEERKLRSDILIAWIHARFLTEKQLDKAMEEIGFVLRNYEMTNSLDVWFRNENIRDKIETILKKYYSKVSIYIENQISGSWEATEKKNDSILEKALKGIGVTVAAYKVIQLFNRRVPDGFDKSTKIDLRKVTAGEYVSRFARNDTAKTAFMQRKVKGLSFSERVWNLKGQNMELIESAIANGIAEGKSASSIARELKQYLNEPDNLFRRVRDKESGKLKLSKAASKYKPGPGKYRSSYKNAERLAREEINLAYRTADYERWRSSEVVTAIEVDISDAHFDRMPDGDICDDLKGIYPKDFFFPGWHVQCLCHATPVLVGENEFIQSLIEGTTIKAPVTRMPENFNSWIKDNKTKIEGWKSKPYFITLNEKFIDG